MATRVCGALEFERSLSEREKVELAFRALALATENKIGIRFGANIWPPIMEAFHFASNQLPFELTDSPLHDSAEALFNGEQIHPYYGSELADTGESLHSRMSRVQRFLQGVLKLEGIKKVILWTEIAGRTEFPEVDVSAGDFMTKIVAMYRRADGFTPIAKFVVGQDSI